MTTTTDRVVVLLLLVALTVVQALGLERAYTHGYVAATERSLTVLREQRDMLSRLASARGVPMPDSTIAWVEYCVER